MTPKEKAQELIDAMLGYKDEYHQYLAIKCALKAVDEIISELEENGIGTDFWYEVKQELETL